MKKATDPMKDKEDISKSNDSKIDQDFKGFPNGNATENTINPSTEEEKKTAAVNITDGEKVNKNSKNKDIDESESDGSGGAFGATENMRDDD